MVEDYSEDNDEEGFTTFEDLPQRAKNLLIHNSGGRKFSTNFNPSHPYNTNFNPSHPYNKQKSSKISLVRRNHPWNQNIFL